MTPRIRTNTNTAGWGNIEIFANSIGDVEDHDVTSTETMSRAQRVGQGFKVNIPDNRIGPFDRRLISQETNEQCRAARGSIVAKPGRVKQAFAVMHNLRLPWKPLVTDVIRLELWLGLQPPAGGVGVWWSNDVCLECWIDVTSTDTLRPASFLMRKADF